MHEQPQRATAVFVDQIYERGALLVALPGAIRFKAQEFAYAEGSFAAPEIGVVDIVFGEIFFREIDAACGVVFMDIANDIGELKGQAQFFREIDGARILETKDVGAGESYGARYPVAIFFQAFEGGIGVNGKVHLRAGN